ncbi:MAG TPA: molecular chaperone DnaJ, partial [Acidimicrobiaceae bacterium]|nr:molecular chaperone DnaJ [Acidimicrobiaceae bacterium]
MQNPATKATNPSLYDLLGMPTSSTQESLQRAYRRLAMLHHPDRQS